MTLIGERPGTQTAPLSNEDFSRSVHALFDTRDHAEAARQDLVAAGIHADAIALLGDVSLVETPAEPAGAVSSGGFWETMKELFMPEDDRDQFAEGVRRGGVTVSVRTDTANHDRVVAILDRDGAVDLDEREESWRNEGWTGYTARDPLSEPHGGTAPPVAAAPALGDVADMSYAPASAGTAGFAAGPALQFPVTDEAAPPVESPGALPGSALSLDTRPPTMGGADRDVEDPRGEARGRTRIRSYLWEVDRPKAGGTEL